MNRLTVTGTKFLTPMQASKEQLLEEIKRHQKYYDRLAAYEDTGLEPEQVKQLNDAFKNSQKKLEKAFDDLLAYKDLEECIEGEEGTQGTVKDLIELMQYRKLESQGLLIKLPCKVGDVVWCIDDIDEDLPWCLEFDYFMIDHIGKTVFLTREEAEKALEDK